MTMARSRFNDPIEPMTLENMREYGVRSRAVSCWQCHGQRVLVDAPPGGHQWCTTNGVCATKLDAGGSMRYA